MLDILDLRNYGEPVSYNATLSDDTNVSSQVTKYSLNKEQTRMRVDGVIKWDGAGGGSNFTVSLPSGWQFATSKMPGGGDTTSAGADILGAGQWFDAGVSYKGFWTEYASTTTVQFVVGSIITGNLFANGDGLKFWFEAPVERV